MYISNPLFKLLNYIVYHVSSWIRLLLSVRLIHFFPINVNSRRRTLACIFFTTYDIHRTQPKLSIAQHTHRANYQRDAASYNGILRKLFRIISCYKRTIQYRRLDFTRSKFNLHSAFKPERPPTMRRWTIGSASRFNIWKSLDEIRCHLRSRETFDPWRVISDFAETVCVELLLIPSSFTVEESRPAWIMAYIALKLKYLAMRDSAKLFIRFHLPVVFP